MRHVNGLTLDGIGGAVRRSSSSSPAASIISSAFGFTLIELMVTIAIIAVLATIAIPNAISWRNNAQFNAAVREVKSAIEGTRMAAIKTNLPASVTFNNNNAFVTQTQVIDNGVPVAGPANNHLLAPGITVNSNFPGNVLTFNSRGMPLVIGTVFIDHDKGVGRDIPVSITGNSRVVQ